MDEIDEGELNVEELDEALDTERCLCQGPSHENATS